MAVIYTFLFIILSGLLVDEVHYEIEFPYNLLSDSPKSVAQEFASQEISDFFGGFYLLLFFS